jgi:hypothetical protein
MPRTCTICSHAERQAIDQALVGDSLSFRNIAERFSLSLAALKRHKDAHLPATLAKAQEAKEIGQADNVLAELRRVQARANLLFDACDRWLRDPDDPTRYEIGPRAEDIQVVYSYEEEGPRGGTNIIRKKERLSVLLRRIEAHHEKDLTFELVETKHADPRDLILKAADTLKGEIELLSKLTGQLQQEGTTNILIAPEWLEVRAVILAALAPHPAAALDVSKALAKVEHVSR